MTSYEIVVAGLSNSLTYVQLPVPHFSCANISCDNCIMSSSAARTTLRNTFGIGSDTTCQDLFHKAYMHHLPDLVKHSPEILL
jgi:hypothetical protein